MTAATRSAGAVTGLLVCVGLGLFGQAGWLAALVLGIVAAVLMVGLLGWMIDGGTRAMHGSDWAPPPPPLEPVRVPETASAPEAAPRAALARAGSEPDADADTGGTVSARTGQASEPAAGPDAAPDDLRAIRGVGAKVEQALVAAGVTRFAQIAAWDDAQIDRMAARIGRGAARIRNDDWVGQAAALAGSGGAR